MSRGWQRRGPTPAALTGALLAIGLWLPGPGAALSPAEKCELRKVQSAGRLVACRMKTEAYALKYDLAVDYSSCASRFATGWQRAESRAGGQCPSSGDQTVVLAAVTQQSEDLGGALTSEAAYADRIETGQSTCYDAVGAIIPCAGTGQDGELQQGVAPMHVDNGDGTVTDARTGLTWEKLGDDGGVHDRDALYTWPAAFTDKITALNAAAFAGHDDWRLPKVEELQSLVNYGAGAPSAHAAFDTACVPGCTVLTCSCTAPAYHWTSTPYVTSFQLSTGLAWIVDFDIGVLTGQQQSNPHRVRAVRGGS